ncbi:Hypothetical predicted protein [Podarcis lilfordi]|uniref:Uncharacterized protein n=1 Tax=Podarcis lilfordi TaxID=74358 RepID=A0AA35P5P2_9SAUR|nr:Hypothetical predicted protein [Podarcis lilfordi]
MAKWRPPDHVVVFQNGARITAHWSPKHPGKISPNSSVRYRCRLWILESRPGLRCKHGWLAPAVLEACRSDGRSDLKRQETYENKPPTIEKTQQFQLWLPAARTRVGGKEFPDSDFSSKR